MGYYPTEAEITYIVAWKDKNDNEGTEETAVVLSRLKFRRE